MKAWYFSDENRKLRYGDGRKIELGVTHKVKGPVKLCWHGLHGSLKIFDALCYAPGNIVWRVLLSGDMIQGTNKIVATERRYIAGGVDISDILYKFARMCALDVIHLWDAPDVVVRWLKTGDESLRRDAQAVSEAVCEYASQAAAWAASRDVGDVGAVAQAAWAAADAVWSVANDNWDEARDDYIKAKGKRLNQLVMRRLKEEKK